jgi:hypothetical protein
MLVGHRQQRPLQMLECAIGLEPEVLIGEDHYFPLRRSAEAM